MKHAALFFAALTVFSLGLVGSATAEEPKALGKFGYWAAFQMQEGQSNVCYMSMTAKPPEKKPEEKDKKAAKKKTKRGDVVLMITHRPNEAETDVISYAAGVKFRPASDVTLKINGKDYTLFTQGDTAWAQDQVTDRTIVAAMRGASSMTVTGTTAAGAPLADTVSLKGMAEAYYAIGKACGLAVSPPPKPKAEKKAPEKKAIPKPQAPKTPAKPSVKHN